MVNMELRWWTVLVLCAVTVQYGLADGDDPLKTPCTESCSQDGGARPAGPRVGESRTDNQRQSVIVVQPTGEKEVEVPNHRVKCTKREKRKTACLNGECYALDMAHMRSAFCECPAKYEGARCEQLSLYFFRSYSAEMKKAGIIAGVFFLLVVIIVVVSVYFSVKKARARRQAAKEEQKNNLDGASALLRRSADNLGEERV